VAQANSIQTGGSAVSRKRSALQAWFWFGVIVVSLAGSAFVRLSNSADGETLDQGEIAWGLVPITYAFVGALIISRQPRNVIGLLLMLPGLMFAIPAETYLSRFAAAPASPGPLLLLAMWFSNWSWLLLILPILLIVLLFPTGQPPSPRWRWLVYFGLFIAVFFIGLVTFSRELKLVSLEAEWSVTNPIGFLSDEVLETYFIGPWFFSLPVFTILCVVSLFMRFRRAGPIEREQIKWLFYACALFAGIYIPAFLNDSWTENNWIWNFLFRGSILTIPAAIGVAILRYRLWDIDLIIRRTLVYTLLTACMALVYLGAVTFLQSLFQSVSGQSSTIAIVLSTLAIAALFNPLRNRIQAFIDRRFYRQKYNAEQALTAFAALSARETNVAHLSNAMLNLAQDTVQPEHVSLWLKRVLSTKEVQG
jgi:hypothetical protein